MFVELRLLCDVLRHKHTKGCAMKIITLTITIIICLLIFKICIEMQIPRKFLFLNNSKEKIYVNNTGIYVNNTVVLTVGSFLQNRVFLS